MTKTKQRELNLYIQQEVIQQLSVQGIVVIGSVAKGTARRNSDIDAVIFLDPFDLYAVPAEAKWRPEDGTFHGICSHVENGIQLDFKRVDWKKWSSTTFPWPEPLCAELSEGWIAFDRHNQIESMILERTHYPDETRQSRLDEAVNRLDWLLGSGTPERVWEMFDPTVAHYRLHSAFDYLVQALFSYNRRWRTFKSRELTDLLGLPWLPQQFEEQLLLATNATSNDKDAYERRTNLLRQFFDELLGQLKKDNFYGSNPQNEAFLRQHDEPGRDWNMSEWVRGHEK